MPKIRRIKEVFKVKDINERRDTRVSFRTSKSVKKELRMMWDRKNFPETARTYPDPYDEKNKIPFSSEQEYLEFVIRCLNRAGKTSWHIFSNILNPDYPNLD